MFAGEPDSSFQEPKAKLDPGVLPGLERQRPARKHHHVQRRRRQQRRQQLPVQQAPPARQRNPSGRQQHLDGRLRLRRQRIAQHADLPRQPDGRLRPSVKSTIDPGRGRIG